jgi:phenylpropionate dioxygenase-like ring-hydroxylating dioxygenase large terminal subunit
VSERFPFPCLPSGWFAVATCDEVKPGQVLSRRYFERDLAIYRTESGVLKVVDAFCPHMGGHLGKIGRVEGESLRCGFHGFRFDTEGRCTGTPYEGPAPVKARLEPWSVREIGGFVMVWFDAEGREPTWEIPELDTEGWSGLCWREYPLATHPQETTENSVDFGHFTQVHGSATRPITREVATDGPHLNTEYAVERHMPVNAPSWFPKFKLKVTYDVQVWGLGYSQVNVSLHQLGAQIRFFVMPVPKDGGHIDLRLGGMIRRRYGPLDLLIRNVAHAFLCLEVEQDIDVWEHKSFVDPPALAVGDGPVATYRRWVKQFYPVSGEPARLPRPRPQPVVSAAV